MRLIDADKIGLTDFEIVMCNGDYKEAFKMLLNKISNQPTAYDIDKVVEELKKNGSRYTKKYLTPYGNNGYREVKAIRVNRAIEIVKQGGIRKDEVNEEQR